MPSWTVDTPVNLEFGDVTELNVRIVGGTVAVLATDDRPSLSVSEIKGRPLQVEHDDGRLTITYEALTWDRLQDLLRPLHDRAAVTVTVPAGCPVRLGVVSASALVSGLTAGASVKGVSGDITLDGLTGDVTANTVSGELLARDIDGTVRFASVSGGLTLADSAIGALTSETVSGQVTADVTLDASGATQINTVAGEVTLRLPSDADAAVRLHSMSGPVRSDFESLELKRVPGGRTAAGNVGAGTGRVSVNTVAGSITLLRRALPHAEPPRAQAGTEGDTR